MSQFTRGYFYDCPSRNHEEIWSSQHRGFNAPLCSGVSRSLWWANRMESCHRCVPPSEQTQKQPPAIEKVRNVMNDEVNILSMTSWNHFTSDEEKVKISNSKFGVKHGSSCSIQIATVRYSQRDPDWIGGFCKRWHPKFCRVYCANLKSSFGGFQK